MVKRLQFAEHFKKRMILLAIFSGIIITTSLPVTYYVLSLDHEINEATDHSKELAEQLVTSIQENPELWEYNVQKFAKIFSQYQLEDISLIQVYNTEKRLVREETIHEASIFDVEGEYPITYNNKVFGYIKIKERTNEVYYISSILLLICVSVAISLGLILYRYPSRIVSDAQAKAIEAYQQVKYKSYHDPLTNLPNRSMLNEYLRSTLANAQENNLKFAILYLDLDRFKMVNDTFGHSNGDKLLKIISRRLLECKKDDEFISRQGGDEFIYIIPEISSLKEPADRAQLLINKLEDTTNMNGIDFSVTTSIGISIYPTDGQDITDLIKRADAAMYMAKERGKNKFCFYNVNLSTVSEETLILEHDLRKGLEQGDLCLYYQPIFNLKNNKLEGMEALIRWNHPKLGLVPPAKFIGLAEETGLIIPLGKWIIRSACLQSKAWQEYGLPSLSLAVNISASQFQHSTLISDVGGILEETGLEPHLLQLEITESMAMNKEEQVIRRLSQLKKLGVKIAVDDFGTGYSSLSYLKQYPVDTIKIDRSFIKDIDKDSQAEAIVDTIINLAENLNLDVIAEGVEEKEQARFLRTHRCHKVQGYLFGKPVPAEVFEATILKSQSQIYLVQ